LECHARDSGSLVGSGEGGARRPLGAARAAAAASAAAGTRAATAGRRRGAAAGRGRARDGARARGDVAEKAPHAAGSAGARAWPSPPGEAGKKVGGPGELGPRFDSGAGTSASTLPTTPSASADPRAGTASTTRRRLGGVRPAL